MTSRQSMTTMTWAVTLATVILATGCGHEDAPNAQQQAFASALRNAMDASTGDLDRETRDAAAAVYTQRDFAPMWLNPDSGLLAGPSWTDRAEALAGAIRNIHTHGLSAERYAPQTLRERLASPPPAAPADQAAAEWALTTRYLRLASDLTRGRFDDGAKAAAWHIARPTFSARVALQALIDDGVRHALQTLTPQTDDYARLRKARRHLVDVIEAGGWPAVETTDLIQPGDHHDAIPALRRRLAIAGDLDSAKPGGQAAGDPTLYDAATEQAVKAFQRRHGIQTDGLIGDTARAMLNYTAEQRLDQVDANLERLRWLPRELGGDRIMVNIAAYWLDAYRDGEAALRMPVIVGEEQNQTPAFDDRLDYLEVNPYWTVPNSIIINEMAPKIVENPDYLDDNNMIVQAAWPLDSERIDPATIDWASYTASDAEFPHVLRQQPGPDNALGQIKFMFPNKFKIYLHDTPAQALFDNADRTFSHGCIRVARPLDLAALILANTEGWDRTRVDETIRAKTHTRVDLAEADRLPVYIYYSTAWADADGVLHFRPDRYERDAALMLALRRTGPRTPEA